MFTLCLRDGDDDELAFTTVIYIDDLSIEYKFIYQLAYQFHSVPRKSITVLYLLLAEDIWPVNEK